MSASLVGSEMCIRDRQVPPKHGEFYAALQDMRRRLAEDRTATQGEAQQPVSYTHLTLPTICSV
eukprot:14421832-Alexandrium_andersonii.AAC.1